MIAKAYGKILVFGAYSILEPDNVGLVLNVDRGTTSEVTETGSGKIIFDMKNFKINAEAKKDFFHLLKNPELKYLKNALQYSFEYLKSKDIKVKDVKLSTLNDPEFKIGKYKTGFGSSATATVSAVAAVLKQHGIDNRETVYKISRFSHYKSQDSTGSGFDIAAACFGSQFFNSKAEDLSDFQNYMKNAPIPEIDRFEWPSEFKYMIAFSGKSSKSEDMIKKIMVFKKKNPKSYLEIMSSYALANNHAKLSFIKEDIEEITRSLELSWELRKKLGEMAKCEIESEKISAILKTSKKNGAKTAGLLGAGGGDSIFAIVEDKDKLTDYFESQGLSIIEDVRLTSSSYEFQ